MYLSMRTLAGEKLSRFDIHVKDRTWTTFPAGVVALNTGVCDVPKICWVGKHTLVNTWYDYETVELPNSRPTQPKKN